MIQSQRLAKQIGVTSNVANRRLALVRRANLNCWVANQPRIVFLTTTLRFKTVFLQSCCFRWLMLEVEVVLNFWVVQPLHQLFKRAVMCQEWPGAVRVITITEMRKSG